MVRITLFMLLVTLAVPSLATAYGEAEDGYPNMGELWVEVYTSSCRQDPDAWQPVWGSPSYSVMGALWHHHGLNVVSRNHSTDMATNDCFSHDSCDGTGWDTRISEYYSGGMFGENIAAGQQNAYEAIVAWLNSEGHRENIYTSGYLELGTGLALGGSYGIYWTQDFGGGAPADRHPVPTAAAEIQGGDLVVWGIVDTGTPTEEVEVQLGLEGDCHDMELIYGQTGAGTYEAAVSPQGENHWNIQIKLGDGTVETWPDEGSWTDDAYSESTPDADCFGTGSDDDDDDFGDDDDDNGPPGSWDDGDLTEGGGCGSASSPFESPGPGALIIPVALFGACWIRRRA